MTTTTDLTARHAGQMIAEKWASHAAQEETAAAEEEGRAAVMPPPRDWARVAGYIDATDSWRADFSRAAEEAAAHWLAGWQMDLAMDARDAWEEEHHGERCGGHCGWCGACS